ncbi:MAG: PKD domain-containing protein [Myxococcales bacterium FL481]|nr:MAG: PKD domain-containing protein [Myxococcales bacterium FL481]
MAIRMFTLSRLLVTASLVATAPLFLGCSADDATAPFESGSVEFRYLLDGGSEITVLHYDISRANGDHIEGDVAVGDSSEVGFSQGGLEPGDDYQIVVTATSTDGRAACEGAASFRIFAGQRTQVDVVMSCWLLTDGPGAADVDVEINVCPTIDGIVASPPQRCVGSQVELEASATDPDGDAISYTWRVDGVVVGSGKTTTYQCETPGIKAVALEADDANCSDISASSITCESCWPDHCELCIEQRCVAPIFGSPDNDELCPIEDGECRRIFDCMRESGCVFPQPAATGCYCGSIVEVTECADSRSPLEPDGPCKELIENSLQTLVREDIIAMYTNASFGAGRAALLIQCTQELCGSDCAGWE